MEFSDRSLPRRSAFRRTIRTLAVASLAIGVPAIVSACSAPPTTGFLIVLDSQLPLTKVIVRVGGQDGSIALCRQYDVTRSPGTDPGNPNADGALRFPANISVQPSHDPEKAKSVRVTLLGYDGVTEPDVDHCTPNVIPASVVRTDVLLQYVKDDFLEVPMPFTLSCVHKECGGDETCRAGECVPLRANDRSYRKLADGLVNAGDCYSLDPCVAPTRLENIDGCRFALPSGRSPSGLSPFATYDFEDGRLAGVEFLTEDVASISGSTLTLNGDLCTKYTNGFVRTISVAQCPALANQTFCPANAEKAASFAAAVDPERFGTGESPDGGGVPDGGVPRDSGSDATVGDAGRDGAANDGSSGDGSGPTDGGATGDGGTCAPSCCGACVSGACATSVNASIADEAEGTRMVAVPSAGNTRSTLYFLGVDGLNLFRFEAGVDAMPRIVRSSTMAMFAIARAGRSVVTLAPPISGGGTSITVDSVDTPSAPSQSSTVPDSGFSSRLLADATYLYAFKGESGVGNLRVTRIPLPGTAGPQAEVDLGVTSTTAIISSVDVTNRQHVFVNLRPTLTSSPDTLVDVNFLAASPDRSNVSDILGASGSPTRTLAIAAYDNVPIWFVGPPTNPFGTRLIYASGSDTYAQDTMQGGDLGASGAASGAATISFVRGTPQRNGTPRIVYVRDAAAASPSVLAISTQVNPAPATARVTVATLDSTVRNLVATNECAYVSRRSPANPSRALIEAYPMP